MSPSHLSVVGAATTDAIALIAAWKSAAHSAKGEYPGTTTPVTLVWIANVQYQGILKIAHIVNEMAKSIGGQPQAAWDRAVKKWGESMYLVFTPYRTLAQTDALIEMSAERAAAYWDAQQRMAIEMQGFIEGVSPSKADRRYQAYTEALREAPGVMARTIGSGFRSIFGGFLNGLLPKLPWSGIGIVIAIVAALFLWRSREV